MILQNWDNQLNTLMSGLSNWTSRFLINQYECVATVENIQLNSVKYKRFIVTISGHVHLFPILSFFLNFFTTLLLPIHLHYFFKPRSPLSRTFSIFIFLFIVSRSFLFCFSACLKYFSPFPHFLFFLNFYFFCFFFSLLFLCFCLFFFFFSSLLSPFNFFRFFFSICLLFPSISTPPTHTHNTHFVFSVHVRQTFAPTKQDRNRKTFE